MLQAHFTSLYFPSFLIWTILFPFKLTIELGIFFILIPHHKHIKYLGNSGLLNDVFAAGKGNNLIRKPAKIYLNNSNLLGAINRSLKRDTEVGGVRETFFVNQVSSKHKICLHDKGDFLVNDQWIIEIGGKNKNDHQIREEQNAYLVLDDMKIGFGKKIPLYLFGFLY